MAKNTKNVMFRTRRESEDRGFRKFSAIFAVSVMMILLVSCLAILNKYDFDIRTAMGGDSVTETRPVTEQTNTWQEEADKTYFFWCADSESRKIRFAWLVNFRLPEAQVNVCALSPDMIISDGAETLESVLAKSGENEAVKKLEELIGSHIDGYIGSDDESFKAMINYLGGAEVTVPEQIEYRSDEFTVILVKGKQNLKADTLFKYLRYLGTIGPRGKNLQSTVLLEILDGILKPSNAEKSERYFSKLSNTVKTNLSIVDYSSAEKGIKAFMQSGIKKRNIVDSPAETVED